MSSRTKLPCLKWFRNKMPSLQVFCFAINQNKKNICIIDTVSDFYGFPREINTETEFVLKKKTPSYFPRNFRGTSTHPFWITHQMKHPASALACTFLGQEYVRTSATHGVRWCKDLFLKKYTFQWICKVVPHS